MDWANAIPLDGYASQAPPVDPAKLDAAQRSAADTAWRFKFKRNWRREQIKVGYRYMPPMCIAWSCLGAGSHRTLCIVAT